jgi:hypothetical protein
MALTIKSESFPKYHLPAGLYSRECVSCEVRTELVYIICKKFNVYRLVNGSSPAYVSSHIPCSVSLGDGEKGKAEETGYHWLVFSDPADEWISLQHFLKNIS